MKEEFLHYVWRYQLLNMTELKTTQNEGLTIVAPGLHNQDTGPDFLNAQIRISDQLWVGNVEIHLRSSDWYWHQHETDENYDAVILHVVWDHDVEVFMKNETPIPTLELKNVVVESIYQNYLQLTKVSAKFIPCEKQISTVDSFLISNWMERLYIERLERKSIFIRSLLQETQNDWDRVLFLLLAKNFGLNKNGDAFFQLARCLPFSIVRKVGHNELQMNALFFGQAGFLEEDLETDYVKSLKKEYQYLSIKFDLHPMSKKQFQFFRMRPSNFPTLRLAQFAALYFRSSQLFTNLMKTQSAEEVYRLFDVQLNDFWKTHYTFSTASKKSQKKLTKTFVDLVIINTIIPLKFCYEQVIHQPNVEQLISFMESIQAEKNSAITLFESLGLEVKNAFHSQALLEQKTNYCAQKRCLECAIGNAILKR